MTNVYDFEQEYDQMARARAQASAEADPDEAARAVKFGEILNTPPTLIPQKDKSFENTLKGKLASQYTQINPHIRDYVNENPMHASVSADDMPQLDKVSQLMIKTNGTFGRTWGTGVVEKAIEGFKEGWGNEPFEPKLSAEDIEFAKKYPALFHEFRDAFGLVSVFNRGFSGGIHALYRALEQGTGNRQLARDLAAGVEMQMIGGGVHAPHAEVKMTADQFAEKYTAKALELMENTSPWHGVENGPPVSVNKLMDDLHVEQRKLDEKNQQELAKEFSKLTTLERVQKFAENFANLHGRVTMGIKYDRLKELYGDKMPEPGDGIIGDVTGAAEAYDFAAWSGGDVVLPQAEWLARVTPEMKRELWDAMRYRPNGIAKFEEANLKEWRQLQEEREKAAGGEQMELPLDKVLEDQLPMRELEPVEAAPKRVEPLESPFREAPEGPLPIRQARQQAGISAPWHHPEHRPVDAGMWAGKPQTVRFPGGEFETLASSKVGDVYEQSRRLGAETNVIGDRIAKLIGDMPVHVLADDIIDFASRYPGEQVRPQGAAYYDPHQHWIVMRESRWRTGGGRKTLLHEMVHGVTARAVESGYVGPAIKALMAQLEKSHPDLKKNYGWTNEHEFMTEAVSNPRFQEQLAKIRLDETTAKAMKLDQWRDKTTLRGIVEMILDFMGLSPKHYNALEAAFKYTEEAISAQMKLRPDELSRFDYWKIGGKGMPEAKEGAPPVVGLFGQEPFADPTKMGMNKRDYNAWQRGIRKQWDRENEAQIAKAREIAKQKVSAQWKAASAVMRVDVSDAIRNHPVVQATDFLRDGIYNGQPLGYTPKLDITKLSADERDLIPRKFYGRGGYDPDYVANMFGFPSRRDMLLQVGEFEKKRGTTRPENYKDELISNEVDRRMNQIYGSKLGQMIEEAYEHILGDDELSLLHSESLALAAEAGLQRPISVAAMKNQAREKFKRLQASDVKYQQYINEAGRAGRDLERAFLRDDVVEAFNQHQRQFWAMVYAREAQDFAKQNAKVDDITDKYTKRDIRGASGEFVPWIQQFMIDHGYTIKRGPQDHAAALEHTGLRNFEALVNKQLRGLNEIYVDDGFLNPNDPLSKKRVRDMTVGERQMFNEAMISLDKVAREENKLIGAEHKEDLAKALEQAIGIIEARAPEGKLPTDTMYSAFAQFKRGINVGLVSHLTIESQMNWLDRDNPRGFFHRYVIYPIYAAAAREHKMIRQYNNALREALGNINDMDNLIKNDFWVDPASSTGAFLELRKRNLYGMIQYAGNRENLQKLAFGYGKKPEEVMAWLEQNSTKEDWERAQRVGNVFKPLFDEADKMAYRMSGVPLKRVELEPLTIHDKTFDGWYSPIEYDPFRPGTSERAAGLPDSNALMQNGYFQATPAHGYAHARTGYIAPVQLSLEIIPIRLVQMIHDINFREPIREAAKLFYNKDFRTAYMKHVGPEWEQQLVPWLKDVANYASYDSQAGWMANKVSEFMRQNAISTFIGFNFHTVAKHGSTAAVNSVAEVGLENILRAYKSLLNPATAIDRYNFVMDNSEFVQARMRNWAEIGDVRPELGLKKGKFATFRDTVHVLGSYPVALSDMISTVPTWLAAYDRAVLEGKQTHGQAVMEADRAVRRAHGSSLIVNKPMIARGNALAQWYTSLYGFFSHIFQKQFEVAWKGADMVRGKKTYEGGSYAPQVIGGFFAYYVIPAMIEEWITPYAGSEKDSWFKWLGKTAITGVSSSVAYLRDAIHSIINWRDPQIGLMNSAFKLPMDLMRDLSHAPRMNTEQIGRTIRHSLALLGLFPGISTRTIGNATEFMYRYNHGLETPKGLGVGHVLHLSKNLSEALHVGYEPGWLTGLQQGTLKQKYK